MSALLAALLMGIPNLIIKDTKVGTGPAAQPFDFLTVEYTGKLLQGGKVFETSKGRAPFELVLGVSRVIEGWQQGLKGMKAGGRRTLSIPAKLAYGSSGFGDVIPPDSDLVFEVELKKLLRAKITTEKKGTGPAAGVKDSVEVHYRGRLEDGKQFDSSYGRDTLLVDLGTGGVIPGFRQALYGIRAGEKRKVVIPPFLGYGEAGIKDVIPGNATLTFEIEAVRLFPKK